MRECDDALQLANDHGQGWMQERINRLEQVNYLNKSIKDGLF
jgi:hypothetical protein